MGWGYSSRCLPTLGDAQSDFIASYGARTTYSGTSVVTWQVNPSYTPTITAGGKLTYQIMYHTAATTPPTPVLQYFQFNSCTPVDSYNYLDAAAMFNFAFIGVFSLWYLAKNLGHIINGVKRFLS